MPKSCCVVGCTNNIGKNPKLKFIPLPCKTKYPERRQLWLQAIRREDSNRRLWDPVSPHTYVCGQHFISGNQINDRLHPDFVPSIFPHRRQAVSVTTQSSRFHSAIKRASHSTKGDTKSKKTKKTLVSDGPPAALCDVPTAVCEQSSGEGGETSAGQPDALAVGFERPLGESERAQMMAEIDMLRKERDEARQQRDTAQENLSRQCLSVKSVEGDDSKCKNMTGLSWAVFSCLHEYLVQFCPGRLFKLPTQDQLFLSLLKLRLNPSVALLSQILHIGHSTLQDMFVRWINIMYAKITFLIHWPDRECLFTTTPPHMSAKFNHLTSIVDCFEIRIEYSRKLKARAKTYSHYKKWTTVKYFIACSPAGSITFLSKGWGGRASDVKIVRQSGFISPLYHQPGDQILADRGFTLQEDFALLGASLITPAFTKGRKQLSGREVEESRVKSNVRIHIERVIGVLKNRYQILNGPLPVQFVKSLKDEIEDKEVATIDKIVHICAALVNMSSSVVFNHDRVGDEK